MPVGALRQRLQDHPIRVPIDDQRRQAVGFPVDQPIRGGVDAKRVAKGRGSRDPVAPAVVAEASIALADHPQRDLGPIAEERVAQRAPIGGHHAHDVAGLGVHRGDVAAIDPRMTGPNPILTAPGDDC